MNRYYFCGMRYRIIFFCNKSYCGILLFCRGADFVTPVLNFCVTVPSRALQKLVSLKCIRFVDSIYFNFIVPIAAIYVGHKIIMRMSLT